MVRIVPDVGATITAEHASESVGYGFAFKFGNLPFNKYDIRFATTSVLNEASQDPKFTESEAGERHLLKTFINSVTTYSGSHFAIHESS